MIVALPGAVATAPGRKHAFGKACLKLRYCLQQLVSKASHGKYTRETTCCLRDLKTGPFELFHHVQVGQASASLCEALSGLSGGRQRARITSVDCTGLWNARLDRLHC